MAKKCPKCNASNPDMAKFCSECAAPLKPSKEVSVTKTIATHVEKLSSGNTLAGRYQIIEELGKGGMGRVYKVHDTEIKEKVALKLLKPEIASDESTIERFRNELKIARRVSHKHVCRMYDIGKEEEKYFITMEYVEGEDLKSHIRQKERLPIDEAIGISKQICEGLVEAHRLGVVHRDLKPQNIMIDKQGDAKIMDFGIARSLEAPGVTATGVIIGTPDYISPEQAEGEEADKRSDLYSLGVIIYEMVTGSVPFSGDTALSVALKHKTQLPQDPRKLNPEISDDLSRLILICMEKDRESRYQTAKELLADLRNIEEGFSLGTKIRPRRETFVTTLIQKKLLFPILVVALVLIGVVIWQLFLAGRVDAFISIAVMPFEDLSPEMDQGFRCVGIADEIRNRILQLENIKVPGRTSTIMLKDQHITEIGRKLNVETVLEGSLQKTEDRLIFLVELVKVSDQYTIMSDRFEGSENDILDLQDEITLTIVDKLKVKLLGEENSLLVKRYTDNPEAYDLYLSGLHHWNKRGKKDQLLAIDYFEKAIEIDPEYALAYTGISDAYNSLISYGDLPPREAIPKLEAAARKALEIDDTLAEAHCSLAGFHGGKWEWESAEREYKIAIELNPKYATARKDLGQTLSWMGRFDEAIIEIKKAQELDPLSVVTNRVAGQVFFEAGRYDQATKEFKKVLAMDPNFRLIHFYLGSVYGERGMYKEALEELKKEKNLSNEMDVIGVYVEHYKGIVHFRMGERNKTQEVLDHLITLSEQTYVPAYCIAQLYFLLGEVEQGFDWLERAYEKREHWLVRIKVDSIFESVRSDPRFKEILRKMNLE